jgi:hypothetical protein
METSRFKELVFLGYGIALGLVLPGCTASTCSSCKKECCKNKEESMCLAQNTGVKKEINSFKECVEAGYPMLKSYPGKCVTDSGKVFIDDTAEPVEVPHGIFRDKNKLCKDTCGDGVCAEMVCMAEDCPCAETRLNCPQDCK